MAQEWGVWLFWWFSTGGGQFRPFSTPSGQIRSGTGTRPFRQTSAVKQTDSRHLFASAPPEKRQSKNTTKNFLHIQMQTFGSASGKH
jgi:hypothetical protein